VTHPTSSDSRADRKIWLALLVLLLLWSCAAAWHSFSLIGCHLISAQFRSLLIATVAYLLATLTMAVWPGQHRLPGAGDRVGVALAVGLVAGLIAILLSDGSLGVRLSVEPNPAAGSSVGAKESDPFGLINVLAAFLGAVLAGLALLAQKSAYEARAEARQAHADMLRVLHSSRLLELAQVARAQTADLWERSAGVGVLDPKMARMLTLAASVCARLSRLLILLHQWAAEPHLVSADAVTGRAETLLLDIRAFKGTQADSRSTAYSDEERLRAECWQPTARIMEYLLKSLHDGCDSGPSSNNPRVLEAIGKVRSGLIGL